MIIFGMLCIVVGLIVAISNLKNPVSLIGLIIMIYGFVMCVIDCNYTHKQYIHEKYVVVEEYNGVIYKNDKTVLDVQKSTNWFFMTNSTRVLFVNDNGTIPTVE